MKTKAFFHLTYLALLTSSCSLRYYQESDFQAVNKIDAHIHVRNMTDSIALQAAADNFQLINVNVNHTDSTLRLQKKYTNAVKWFGIKG